MFDALLFPCFLAPATCSLTPDSFIQRACLALLPYPLSTAKPPDPRLRRFPMIIFRCDASPQLGMGHLSRCRTLAEEFVRQGETCVMVGPPEAFKTEADHQTFQSWIPKTWGPTSEDDATFLCSLVKDPQTDRIILDDYRVDEPYQLTVRERGLHWLQFDYQANQPLWADWILNANPTVDEKFYTEVLRNPNTQLLLGPQYAIIRPEFREAAEKKCPRDPNLILICMGGGDDRGSIRFILKNLLPKIDPDIHFTVISGASNPRNDENQEWILKNGNDQVQYLVNASNIPELFCKARVGILAGGTTTYEAACCGLPMMIMTIAENQRLQAHSWQHLGAAICLDTFKNLTHKDFVQEVLAVLKNPQKRNEMSIRSAGNVDGQASFRITTQMKDKTSP